MDPRVSGLIYCSGTGLNWQRHRLEYHERARSRLTSQQIARRDLLESRDRTRAEEVEWRTLCWLPDFADPARAWQLAAAEAEFPYPINFDVTPRLPDLDRRVGTTTPCTLRRLRC